MAEKKRYRVMRGIHIVSVEPPTHGLPPADIIYATGDVFESDKDMLKQNGRDSNMEPKFQVVPDSEPVSEKQPNRELTKPSATATLGTTTPQLGQTGKIHGLSPEETGEQAGKSPKHSKQTQSV